MTKNNDERGLAITELPTDEYPVLADSTVSMEQQVSAEPNAPGNQPSENKPAAAQAALSLTHLDAEVSRLHAKWQSIDAEFKSREERIAQLHEELRAHESTISQLTAAAERDVAALEAADERLLGKDAEITALTREQHARDERIAALSQAATDAEATHKETLDKLALAVAETERLEDRILREQETASSVAERNRQTLVEHEALQSKLQDLETYIDGRRERWSELNTELAAHKQALHGKEETIKARDAIIGRHDEEKRQLLASIHDLECRCSELNGRRKEREDAYEELQKKLASHLAQAEQMKGAYATRAKETEQATKQALDSQLEIESLERTVKQRDERIEALTAEIEQGAAAVSELATVKTDFLKRVDELEKGIAERVGQLESLRDDLQRSQAQLRLAQEQLADRTARHTAAEEALDHRSRQAERLTAERDAALKESVSVRAELDALGARASQLSALHADAVAEAKALQAALATRSELISRLETELRAKQATVDLLERSVGRITDLGASLAALDDRMNGGGRKHDAPPPPAVAADLATPAADPKATAAAPLETLLDEPQPLDLDADAEIRLIDVDERPDVEAARKLVLVIGGQTLDYPILKKHMTIGRGRDSDIRVPSHFVSRVHAKISTKGAATIIEDAGSKNGVLVNSERVLRRVLRDGDVVCLGDDLNMRFVDARH